MARSRNIFLIGRKRNDEDELTEMLVWLAEAVPPVRGRIVELGLGKSGVDPGEVEVSTQHGIVAGRLDAYFTGPDFALIVESKLGAVYEKCQIRRYLEWLRSPAVAQPRRALMTLTAADAPWDQADEQYADEHGIVRHARRWEELHAVLEPAPSDAAVGVIGARLVAEFLEMLSEEGLVPTRPLDPDELGPAWADAFAVVRRYREFFHACKGAIAEQLGASQMSSYADNPDWCWQDYRRPDGTRVLVGLYYTDEKERLPAGTQRRTATMWIGVLAEHLPDWSERSERMGRKPPPGWSAAGFDYGRPVAWRYLSDVVGEGTFEQQRQRLAAAAAAAADAWIVAPPSPGPKPGEEPPA
jgi:hypothetical protein